MFQAKAEAELCACLRGRTLPPLPLQQAIAVSKVTAVEESIEACFRLKQEVGSYALMARPPSTLATTCVCLNHHLHI